MSDQIDSKDELRDWQRYRKIVQRQVDAFAGTGPVFVTKDKFEFEVNGRPWRSQAVLLGAKGRNSVQALKKQGVVFKEGTAERRAEGLVVSGFGGSVARGALATLTKLALGVDVVSSDPVDDDDEADVGSAGAATAAAPSAGAASPGRPRAEAADENTRLKKQDIFLLTMAIDALHRLAQGGPDDFVTPKSGKAKLDSLGAALHAIVVDPRFAGKRGPAWQQASARARTFFRAAKKRIEAADVERLYTEQVAQAEQQLDAVQRALDRSDALAELQSVAADGKRQIADAEREHIEQGARARREQLRQQIGGGDGGIQVTYDELRMDPELRGVVDQADAATRKQLGRDPGTADDQLVWIDNLQRTKKIAQAAVAKAAAAIRSKVFEVAAHWDNYVQQNRGSSVARIAELFGGAVPMRRSDFERAEAIATSAIDLVQRGRIRSAADALALAIDTHGSLLRQWREFDTDTVRGAGVAVVALTVVKEASFAIVATYTGGAAAAALKVGAIGTVAVTAAVNVAASAAKSGAAYVGHVFAGTTEQFDVNEEFYAAIKSGASSVAGGAVSGFAKARLAEKLTRPLAAALESRIGPGVGKFAGKILDRLVYDLPEAIMGRVVEGSIDAARGKSFGSTEEFLDFLAEDFARGGAADLFTSALTGKKPKSTDAIVEALSAGISG